LCAIIGVWVIADEAICNLAGIALSVVGKFRKLRRNAG